MGKLHSKHAAVCKPRESPEGDSFAVNASLARKGIEDWMVKQKYCGGSGSGLQQGCPHRAGCRLAGARDPSGEGYRETIGDEHFHLEVALPPEKTDGVCSADEKKAEKENDTHTSSKKQLKFEDITSLLHTIYEVVDASVNHSPSSSKTLRVKLTVAPDGSQRKKSILLNHTDLQSSRHRTESKASEELRGSEKKQRASLRYHYSDNNPEQSGCYRHCVDENIERRNHYLDLAGIENYTSKFGPGSPPAAQKQDPPSRVANQTRSRSHEPETFHAHHRKSQVVDPSHINLADTSYAKIAEIQQRLRNQDSNKHFVRSPKSIQMRAISYYW
ncbi:naked cuticle-like protein 1 isoform B [Alligator mississippiensis]|uniref:Protein naked cuticle homolog n=1 Tax=Alligator mississippiensis TaxID=8496 RepID=A0A151MS46_ALLMI|nr:naked cuticle-like protein 1 isoform B [Alligator mississippiensis]